MLELLAQVEPYDGSDEGVPSNRSCQASPAAAVRPELEHDGVIVPRRAQQISLHFLLLGFRQHTGIAGGMVTTGALIGEDGTVVDVSGEPLALDRFVQMKTALVLSNSPKVSFAIIESTLQNLQQRGIQVVFRSGRFHYYDGRLYYLIHRNVDSDVRSPEVSIDNAVIGAIAKAAGYPGNALSCFLYMNEVGEIVAVAKSSAPDIPAVESVLRQARVLAPAIRLGQAVPAALLVVIPVR